MSELKQSLRVEKIANDVAVRILERNHPLGAGHAFAFALGVFWQGRCEGVMTFGNPISNLAVVAYGLKQYECLELRKMWMSDVPPKNSESRFLSVACKIVRKRYPHLKCLITYCDAEEHASSYKAVGWIPQQKHTYVREVKIGDKWLTVRNANRLGVMKQVSEKKMESRQKYVLPFCASVAQLVERCPSRVETADRNRPGRLDKSTSNNPSLPETGDGSSSGRGLESTQANSRTGSTSQPAATASEN